MRCEMRTLDDIRRLGGNDIADERRFAAVDRVSQTNLALYRSFAQPFVRALVNPYTANLLRDLHPLRLQYEICSDANPLMTLIAGSAEQVRANRKPVAADNPLVAIQENMSTQIVAALDAWREASEAFAERTFMAVYGAATLQAAAGIDPAATLPLRKAAKSAFHHELMQRRTAELKSRIAAGGVREAVIRALLFAGMGRAAVDERGFEAVRRIRQNLSDVPLSVFKTAVRDQFNLLLLDPEAALAAIPSMLPDDPETRRKAFDLISQVLSARGEYSPDDQDRIQRVGRLFGVDDRLSPGNLAIASDSPRGLEAKAS